MRRRSSQRVRPVRFSGLLRFGREALGGRKQEQRDHEGELETDRPDEFRRVGILLDVQEPFQSLDGGNGYDRAEQLQLEAAEVALGHSLRPIRMLLKIDFCG
jgi:hypothetical protein